MLQAVRICGLSGALLAETPLNLTGMEFSSYGIKSVIEWFKGAPHLFG